MHPLPIKRKQGPEAIIQEEFVKFLRYRGWYVKETHGNLYQSGFPDVYATHSSYGIRWVECKCPTQYCFTAAQLDNFPKLTANGTGIWIIVAATEEEYQKLWRPPNWHIYLLCQNQRSAHHLRP